MCEVDDAYQYIGLEGHNIRPFVMLKTEVLLVVIRLPQHMSYRDESWV